MANPKFNREIKDRVEVSLPLAFRRVEDPLLGASLFSALLDGEVAVMDEGLLHGRSDIEKGIRWKAQSRAEIPNAHHYRVAWIAVRGGGTDAAYHGVTISEFFIDRPQRLGAKDLPAQVNAMSRALAGQVEVTALPDPLRRALGALLQERGAHSWANSSAELRAAFA
ncbi:MAG: YwhD family protein [Sulfobacillus sp.]